MPLVSVLIINSHTPVLAALTQVVRREEGVGDIWTAQTGQEALERGHASRPDLVFIDLPVAVLRELDLVRQLKTVPSPPYVVLLTLDDVALYQALLSVLDADTVMDKRSFATTFTPFLERFRTAVGRVATSRLFRGRIESVAGQAPPWWSVVLSSSIAREF